MEFVLERERNVYFLKMEITICNNAMHTELESHHLESQSNIKSANTINAYTGEKLALRYSRFSWQDRFRAGERKRE